MTIEDAISRRLETWARIALAQVKDSSDPLTCPSWLADDLAALLETVGPLDPEALAAAEVLLVSVRVPAPVGLRRLLIALGQARVRSLRGTGDTAELGTALHNLGVDLAEVGEHEKALEATTAALAIRQALAKTDKAHRIHVARTWHSMAIRRAAIEDHDGAIDAARNAVAELEAIARLDPTRMPDLARALHNLATKLSRQMAHDEALEAARRSVEMRRCRLADEGSDVYGARYDLAISLINLAGIAQRHGSDEEENTQEAIDLLVSVIPVYPEAAAYLGAALHNLAESRLSRGDAAGANRPARRAVEIRREVAASGTSQLAPLGRTLLIAAQVAAALGHPDAAVLATEAAAAFADSGPLHARDRSALAKAEELLAAQAQSVKERSKAKVRASNTGFD